jgi:REP element-mobilizing transposase RayT
MESAIMANTYTQIYLHVVFAVCGRACMIQPHRKEELQKYITGIVTRRNQKLIAINCMPDHTHILLGLRPDESPSNLIGPIKTGFTNHINEQRWDRLPVFVARSIRCFFCFAFSPKHCHQLHRESGGTPSSEILSTGIHRLSRAA